MTRPKSGQESVMVQRKMNVLGRVIKVDMDEEIAAAHRRWVAKKGRWRKKARQRIEDYRLAATDRRSDCLAAAIEAIILCTDAESSESRLRSLLLLVGPAPSEIFWRTFLDCWSVCDDTWHGHEILLEVLRRHSRIAPALPYFSPAQRWFFDALPPRVSVFRGCSRERIQTLSWTTDRLVANRFANGHRGISIPDPVVVSAQIDRSDIFAVFVDRKESELILDPAELRSISIE